MDITQLVPAPQAVITLTHPVTGQPVATSDGQTQHVKAYGSDSRQYKAAMADHSRRMLEYLKDKPADHKLSEAESNQMTGQFLADVVTEVLYEDGDGVHTDVKQFCGDERLAFWHSEIDTQLGRRTNFMPA